MRPLSLSSNSFITSSWCDFLIPRTFINAHADGPVTGKLVMIETTGERHEYHFTSGGKKESKGPLPGLASDRNLGPHGDDPLKPQAVYAIRDRVPARCL
jgi:hypothetical protein